MTRTKSLRQFLSEARKYMSDSEVMWHGSPSGELKGSYSGIHVGTKLAATQALTARIGHPVEGEWDGTREYGKTKLAGKKTLRARGPYLVCGHNCDAPEEDYYPHEHPKGFPKFSDQSRVQPHHKPSIMPYRIKGQMSNHRRTPHSDSKANALMVGMIKKGKAKSGFYYKNDGEDTGSISAVVPNKDHLEPV